MWRSFCRRSTLRCGAREDTGAKARGRDDFPGAAGSRRSGPGAGSGLRDGRRHHADDGSWPHPRDTQSRSTPSAGGILCSPRSPNSTAIARSVWCYLAQVGRRPWRMRDQSKWRGSRWRSTPGSARFPSMPISAIETGCVRFVLRPNELARELIRLSGYMRATPPPRAAGMVAPRPGDPNPQAVGHSPS